LQPVFLSLGLLIGILVGWYVNEVKIYTEQVVTSSIGIFAGGGVMAIFHSVAPSGATREYWLYPVGLLIGVLVAPPLDLYFIQLYKKKKAR